MSAMLTPHCHVSLHSRLTRALPSCGSDDREAGRTALPGNPTQSVLLYHVACEFEIVRRDYVAAPPVPGETVKFYDHKNLLVEGQVLVAHPPVADQPLRFDIQVGIKGTKNQVLFFHNVKRSRIARASKNLACDEDWLKYAATISSFEKYEITPRDPLVAC